MADQIDPVILDLMRRLDVVEQRLVRLGVVSFAQVGKAAEAAIRSALVPAIVDARPDSENP